MQGRIKREVHLHIPLQIVHYRSHTANLLNCQWIVGHVIGQNIPMSGWGFGAGAVSPKLRQNAREIAPFHHIGRVGQASNRVGCITVTIVEVEVTVAVITRVSEAVAARRAGARC